MPQSDRLRAADVRAVFLLAGECRDLGDDPVAWRRHLAAGAARLAGLRADRPRDLGGVPWGFDHGFDVAGWRLALDHLAVDPNYSVLLNRYAERVRAGGGGALGRTDLIPTASGPCRPSTNSSTGRSGWTTACSASPPSPGRPTSSPGRC